MPANRLTQYMLFPKKVILRWADMVGPWYGNSNQQPILSKLSCITELGFMRTPKRGDCWPQTTWLNPVATEVFPLGIFPLIYSSVLWPFDSSFTIIRCQDRDALLQCWWLHKQSRGERQDKRRLMCITNKSFSLVKLTIRFFFKKVKIHMLNKIWAYRRTMHRWTESFRSCTKSHVQRLLFISGTPNAYRSKVILLETKILRFAKSHQLEWYQIGLISKINPEMVELLSRPIPLLDNLLYPKFDKTVKREHNNNNHDNFFSAIKSIGQHKQIVPTQFNPSWWS